MFRGWQKESLIEWPGKIVSVVFVGGCNFRCPFCYNRDLVFLPEADPPLAGNPEKLPDIKEEEILRYLAENRNLLDGVMITGGEPLQFQILDFRFQISDCRLQIELFEFIKEVKGLGLGVGIETNGSYPEALEYLIESRLVDYVAMDVKAPLAQIPNSKFQIPKYNKLSGVRVNLEKIRKSIEIIKGSGIDYEFRTTVVPKFLDKNDIFEIANYLRGAKRYILQQFRPEESLINPELKKLQPYSQEYLEEIKKNIEKYFKICEVR